MTGFLCDMSRLLCFGWGVVVGMVIAALILLSPKLDRALRGETTA